MIKTKVNKLIKNGLRVTVYLLYASLLVACASTAKSNDSGVVAETIIEKTSYTNTDIIPSYFSFYSDGGFIDDKGWIGNSSSKGNVPVDEKAITIDLSKISGVSVKEGDKLSISMSITNCNGSNAAAIGLYLDSTEVAATGAFIGNSGSKQESFSKTIVVPAEDGDGYQLYLKVLEKECRVKIKNLEVKNESL